MVERALRARFSDNARLRIESELAQGKRAQERPLHLKTFCRGVCFSRQAAKFLSDRQWSRFLNVCTMNSRFGSIPRVLSFIFGFEQVKTTPFI